MSTRRPRFNQSVVLDTTPLPEDIPPVKEIGASSAPLLSAAFFIGARCKAFNDDYMKCKTDARGTGEIDCMREGRKVTRCAASVLDDISKNCLYTFRQHWACLENNNHQLTQCRGPEQLLNHCVFEKLGLQKEIPGAPAPELETPVHLRETQIFSLSRRYNKHNFPKAWKKATEMEVEEQKKEREKEKEVSA